MDTVGRPHGLVLCLGRTLEGAQYLFAVALGTHVAQLPIEVLPQPPEEQHNHDELQAEPSRENEMNHSSPMTRLVSVAAHVGVCAGYTKCLPS
jgi:hypothetical protein